MAVNVLSTAPKTPTPEALPPSKALELTYSTRKLINSYRSPPEDNRDLDYFLTPAGELIRVEPKCYRERDHLTGVLKEHPDALPLVWCEWLAGPDEGAGTLQICDSSIIIATGLKGGGKSLTMAYLGAKALASPMPVWSNMNIKFYLVNMGMVTLCESKPLDWAAFLTLSKVLKRGAIVIDELTYFLSSRQSQSVRNRIINAGINQVRKRTLDFYASVKFLRQADVNLREEMDAEISCQDYAKTGQGQHLDLPRGCVFEWWVRDISGWSGSPAKHIEVPGNREDDDRLGDPVYRDSGIHREFDGRWLWPIYDSYEVVDASDAFRKVKLDLQELVVSDKEDGFAVDETIQSVIDAFRDKGLERVTTTEMYRAVMATGIKIDEAVLGKRLRNQYNITKQKTREANYYKLEQ